MHPWNIRQDAGNAILEFTTFILVGQLTVFAGSLAISESLADKVELQALASTTARSISHILDYSLPAGVVLSTQACSERLVCITLTKSGQSVAAVSIR